jgi:hypothetical protein
MMTGTSGRAALAFRQQIETTHSGHVDVGQDQNQRFASGVVDTLKSAGR